MYSRPIHFEIHANDPEKTAQFYRDLFGWEITKWESPDMEYWIVMTAPKDSVEPGINGGLVRRKGPKPESDTSVSAFVCTMGVENLDASMKKAVELGGSIALPKFALTGMAWQGYCKDPDGNIFGLHQPDPNAK